MKTRRSNNERTSIRHSRNQAQWSGSTRKPIQYTTDTYPTKPKLRIQRPIGVQPNEPQDCVNNLQQYKYILQDHAQELTKDILYQRNQRPAVSQAIVQTLNLLLLLVNTSLAALTIFLLSCLPYLLEPPAPAAMSSSTSQDPPRRREGLTPSTQARSTPSDHLEPEDPLGPESMPSVTPASSEAETLTNLDFRQILQAIANGVNVMAKENQRSYANERAPFADVPLLFNGENVTLFIKQIEQRSAFYQWTIEDRILRLLSHCDHVRRDIIESSMTEFAVAKENLDWQGIRSSLRKRFRSQDQAQREETEDSLRAWCLSCSLTTNLSLQSYLDSFGPRFNRCLEAGTVQSSQKGFFLTRGLNKERLNKVLNKFDLSITAPSTFGFEKIEPFLSKMASREAEIEAFNPALGKNNRMAKTPSADVPLGPAQTTVFRTPQLDPNIILRPSQQSQRPRGEHGVQMPPGQEPTQSEVDDLIEKFTKIKLSGMNLSVAPQEPREAELLGYPDIQQAIGAALALVANPASLSRSFHNQLQNDQLSQNQPQSTRPGFQQNSQVRSFSEQQGNCYACGRNGHISRFCEQKDALIRNRWVHANQQGRLNWGTQENPEGEIRNVPGTHIIQTVIEGIQGQLRASGKPVIDPLTTRNPYENRPQREQAIQHNSNTIVQSDRLVEDSGVIEEDAFLDFLRKAGFNEPLRTSATVSATTLADPTKSNCQPNVSAIKPISSYTPTVRNNKSRDADWIRPKSVTFDDTMDLDDGIEGASEVEPKAAPKKHRVLDALQADPDKMMRQMLGTTVEVPLRDLLAIAPELQKRFGKPYYTMENLETLFNPQASPQSSIGPRFQNNNIALSCPEYIHVESENGFITRAGTRSYQNGPGLAVAPSFPREWNFSSSNLAPFEETEQPRTTAERREYDRDHGYEHVRRDCPRAPMMIHDARLSALLDSGAELNTMRLKTAQTAGLVVTSMPREMGNSRMQSANGTFESFAGMVWRAPVSIGNIVIPTNFFILKALSNPVILGNPYLADAQTQFAYGADGKMTCTIFSEDRSSSASFIGATDNTFGTISRTTVTPKGSGA
jgi:hypothetical protein